MNLLEQLTARIDALPQGAHSLGLRAVLQHVQVAMSHLSRGQKSGDETAFTDAIYRCNQAFEGSLKEAYLVLAGKDPAKLRPYDIENHFQTAKLLRPRVLSQFTTYRTEWRNPSAHDYQLDFDEDEALLAIVSVSVFAIVLVDQIAEKLGFISAKEAAVVAPQPVSVAGSLPDAVVAALRAFVYEPPKQTEDQAATRGHEIGALAGYLTATLPGATVETEKILLKGEASPVDLLVTRGPDRVIIELRRGLLFSLFRQNRMARLAQYMQLAGIPAAIYYAARRTPGEMVREVTHFDTEGVDIIELRPKPTTTSTLSTSA